MNGSAYFSRLNNNVSEYIKNGVVESLVRNNHMNFYDEEQIDVDDVRKHLMLIVTDFCKSYKGSNSSIDVIEGLVKVVKNHRFIETSYRQTTVDAYLVDFLNHFAMNSGIDLAIYTSDL